MLLNYCRLKLLTWASIRLAEIQFQTNRSPSQWVPCVCTNTDFIDALFCLLSYKMTLCRDIKLC